MAEIGEFILKLGSVFRLFGLRVWPEQTGEQSEFKSIGRTSSKRKLHKKFFINTQKQNRAQLEASGFETKQKLLDEERRNAQDSRV